MRIIGFPIEREIYTNTMADEFPPYVPMPSLGHELGLMFGFFSLCLAVMVAYVVIWRGESSFFRFNVSPAPKDWMSPEGIPVPFLP